MQNVDLANLWIYCNSQNPWTHFQKFLRRIMQLAHFRVFFGKHEWWPNADFPVTSSWPVHTCMLSLDKIHVADSVLARPNIHCPMSLIQHATKPPLHSTAPSLPVPHLQFIHTINSRPVYCDGFCILRTCNKGCSRPIVAQRLLTKVDMRHAWLLGILTVSLPLANPLWNHLVCDPSFQYLWATRMPQNSLKWRLPVHDWAGPRSARALLKRNPRKNLRPPRLLT